MAQHRPTAARPSSARPSSARPGPAPGEATGPKSGTSSWSRERRIYLAVGILACLAGVMIIAFSR
ncbi:hypothetical protein [Arthrobacter sp. ISL-72]|uniref:hypothetical protein n=1 Tax=Arthrobacter sp. ISL-72 TaxID=2819114 RepID=UPI001BEA584F|nr:hypothetical protein [Arthrobacter sp. ISL-72]MBT2596117.1 hypothetical protein [Arthrobacter sp. ISL-72]